MNTLHRKNLPGTKLDYFDTRAAVDAIAPGAVINWSRSKRALNNRPVIDRASGRIKNSTT